MLVFGLNYRTAPVGLLERLAVPDHLRAKAFEDLLGREHVREAVVLSTCNRVEVYAAVSRYHGGVADLRHFAAEWAGVPIDDLAPLAYDYFEERAAAHLFAVASGLDSMVVGERQIHGQVREAFKQADDAGAVGRLLGALFRQSMRVAKRARVETDLDAGRATMVDVGLQAAERALGDLHGCRALIVGAGQMGGIAAERLASVASSVTVTNRTADRAEELAAKVGGAALPFTALREALAEADLVLTSTGAGEPVIGYADVEAAVAGRAGRRLALVDLAVPRDVDQACAGVPGVTVLDIDAVRTLTDAGERGVDVRKARAIVEEAASSYAGWTRTVQVEPTVRGLRTRAEEIRQSELARLEGRLGELDESQRAAVDTLTRGIINTLLHEPTVRLKRHADHRGAELYATALAELFDLPAAGDPTVLPSDDAGRGAGSAEGSRGQAGDAPSGPARGAPDRGGRGTGASGESAA